MGIYRRRDWYPLGGDRRRYFRSKSIKSRESSCAWLTVMRTSPSRKQNPARRRRNEQHANQRTKDDRIDFAPRLWFRRRVAEGILRVSARVPAARDAQNMAFHSKKQSRM